MPVSKRLLQQTRSLLNTETGTVYKQHGGKVRVCLIYPNTYYVGMSNLGFRLVYSILNARSDVVCERAFLPSQETIVELLRTRTPLYGMESITPVSGFDIVGFSVSFENDYPNLLKILRLSRLPVYAKDRDHRAPLVIMGGPCALLNPEPLSEFIDVVFIGEAEAMLDGFIDVYRASAGRDELFDNLRGFSGIYVPSRYVVHYNDDGRISKRVVTSAGYPDVIRRSYVKDLNTLTVTGQIITPQTEFSSMYLVEAMRGCPWGCRFCAVRSIYGPPRKKGLETVTQQVDRSRQCGGRVGLIGASLTDYPHIKDVLTLEGVEFSITSLRASRRSVELLSLMRNKNSVSLAPETGSERLRRLINKQITRQDIIETATLIFNTGISTLRLYFMLGLPTETDDDVLETVELVKTLRGLTRRTNIVMSISVFVPKPQTPFQWHPMVTAQTVKHRLRLIKDALKADNVKVFHDIARHAYLEGLLAVGDRRLCRVLEFMGEGSDWRKACQRAELSVDFYIHRQKDPADPLPWDFIDCGTGRDRLLAEYEEGREEKRMGDFVPPQTPLQGSTAPLTP
ncbi:radical SAM domain-containing protein [Candidatus Magnetobacterium bavaricum]|uniref:Radical SAM domain-containing protein n=1 Tax=Candidatus Magnetobacterium bavaricum TaxID=29290 RepID=A0A0F3GS83_9BACT|nr:radical SAM domain-containing protein [Candidatus Magnetobacterium bavaricum]